MPLAALLRHFHELADSPPIPTGRRNAEQLLGIRSELGPPYAVRRMQIKNAVLENESFALALNAFEGVEIWVLRRRSQKVRVQGLRFRCRFGKRIRFDRLFYFLWLQQEYLGLETVAILDCGPDLVRKQRGLLLALENRITALNVSSNVA